MNIYLIRHGLTTPGEEGRYQGFLDESLSEKGRDQLIQAPQKPSHVYVSPSKRARETATILFPGAEQICVPGLWEMNFGVFEGRTWKEMENDARYREWVDGMCLGTCPGGESRASFSARVCKAFLDILDIEKARQQNTAACNQPVSAAGENHFEESIFGKSLLEEDLFIVSHGGTQMAILERWGRPARDYFSWQRPCGCGWMLSLGEPAKIPADWEEQDEQNIPKSGGKNPDDCGKNSNEHEKNTDGCGKNSYEHEKNTDDCGKNSNDRGQNANCGDIIELQVLEELTFTKRRF